jgi:hypothetical protein
MHNTAHNRIKAKKHHMNISVGKKIQHPFIIKAMSKLGKEE